MKGASVYLKTQQEAELFRKFLQYRKQWEKLFNSDANSVHIHKNPQDKRLEIWEWYEKEVMHI